MSIATTIFGPKVSFTTTGTNDPAAGRVEIAVPLTVSNTATLSGANTISGDVTLSGDVTSTGTYDASSGRLLSRVSTLSANSTAASLRDGEYGFFAQAASKVSLAFRSGQTTYFFSSDGASVA